MVLENEQSRLAISILDYEESKAINSDDRNTLLVSIEVEHEGKSSIVTAPVIATYELAALADWFEKMANGFRTQPVVLLEPCLFFDCTGCATESFQLMVRMEAEASPTWTNYYAEPFAMHFKLTGEQMAGAARALRQLHLNYPTQR